MKAEIILTPRDQPQGSAVNISSNKIDLRMTRQIDIPYLHWVPLNTSSVTTSASYNKQILFSKINTSMFKIFGLTSTGYYNENIIMN